MAATFDQACFAGCCALAPASPTNLIGLLLWGVDTLKDCAGYEGPCLCCRSKLNLQSSSWCMCKADTSATLNTQPDISRNRRSLTRRSAHAQVGDTCSSRMCKGRRTCQDMSGSSLGGVCDLQSLAPSQLLPWLLVLLQAAIFCWSVGVSAPPERQAVQWGQVWVPVLYWRLLHGSCTDSCRHRLMKDECMKCVQLTQSRMGTGEYEWKLGS